MRNKLFCLGIPILVVGITILALPFKSQSQEWSQWHVLSIPKHGDILYRYYLPNCPLGSPVRPGQLQFKHTFPTKASISLHNNNYLSFCSCPENTKDWVGFSNDPNTWLPPNEVYSTLYCIKSAPSFSLNLARYCGGKTIVSISNRRESKHFDPVVDEVPHQQYFVGCGSSYSDVGSENNNVKNSLEKMSDVQREQQAKQAAEDYAQGVENLGNVINGIGNLIRENKTKKDQKRADNAKLELKKEEQIKSNEVTLLFSEINLLIEKKKYYEVIPKLKLAITKEPENIPLYYTLGNVYDLLKDKELESNNKDIANKHYDNAEKYFKEALKKDSKYFDALYSLGALYYNKAALLSIDANKYTEDYSYNGTKKYEEIKGDIEFLFDKALPHFKNALKEKPNDTYTINAIKEIEIQKNKTEQQYSEKPELKSLKPYCLGILYREMYVNSLKRNSIIEESIKLPSASPHISIDYITEHHKLNVSYSRVSVRGRKFLGDLIPFGQLWRTGANKNTILTFENDVEINNEKIKAGYYALYTIPDANEWTIILYKDIENYGIPEKWDENKVACRFNIKTERLQKVTESLSIYFENESNTSVSIIILIDQTKIKIPIKILNNTNPFTILKQEIELNKIYLVHKYLNNSLEGFFGTETNILMNNISIPKGLYEFYISKNNLVLIDGLDSLFIPLIKQFNDKSFGKGNYMMIENMSNNPSQLILKTAEDSYIINILHDTQEYVLTNIAKCLKANPTASNLYYASRYYREIGKDLNKALEWINKSIEMGNDRFWILYQKSLLEADLGNYKAAIDAAKISLAKSKEAGNDDYIKMNSDSIAKWSKKLN